ncbi:MAG: PKD domain-containing protein [Acidobacteriota bacterium]|nr:PKD domain-containing protein [Acidobacteriota bacterium]
MALALTGNTFAQNANASERGLARGQAAINKLGARLPEVASRHGKSANELKRLFLEDSTLFVDDTDALLYVDETQETQEFSGDSPTVSAAAPYPYSQTFALHSRPGSNRVIYLDFDGHVTSNTAWNANYTGGAPINSAPFSIDSDPTTFNQQELDAIQYIWQRVAEDFAPYNVDVTTQDPGDDAIIRSSSSDSVFGTRVVISPTNFTGSSIGGIAYVGVFNYTGTYYKPAFVMSGALGNSEKNIAEATSHEVGHNLGLSHDGNSTTGYYSGHGDWAPIMGVGYYKNVTQWSKGEYPGANQLEDDLAVMQNYGIPLLTDDYGNTLSSATALSGMSISASGIIATRTDVDVFQFSTGSGTVTININPAPRGGNLDIQAQILDSAGNVLATSNPTGLSASFSQYLSSGVYYLKIDGVGAGDLSTGYSDYASIGQYNISGTLVASSGQAPVASVSATPTSGTVPLTVYFYSTNSYDPDGSIVKYAWNFGDGTTSSEANPVKIYNSAGTFTAVLTVTDNSGMTGSGSVVITASQAANQSPVAVAKSNTTSGYAPLTVNFSGQESYDPDGTIASYSWNFGDGTTSTQANPSKTYNNVGNYTATLTVTDNGGAKSSSSVLITVQQNPNAVIYVNSISMSIVKNGGRTYARAVVTVYDGSGAPRPNVTVSGSWSGLTTGNVTGTTNSSGQIVFNSSSVKTRGTFTFTVTNLSASGYTYNSTLNKETSDSISN